jgi:3-dehydroquinate synthetase/shikimate kinase
VEALGRASGEAAAAAGSGERGALVLVGFMGAGKSTTARMLAAELGVESIDSDREVERELGEPIDSFFDRQGEQAFRAREEEVVLRILSEGSERVVALGGGSLGSERVREALARHLVVHLEVEPDESWRRASNRARPLARDRARFDQLHRERLAVYESMADASLPAGDRNLPRRALGALRALRSAPPGTRLVWASAESAEYPVFFGHGLVADGFFYPSGSRRFVVTDPNVAAHHPLQSDATIEIPPGESEKTLARAEQVLRELARAGATRADLVVAVGGGVVGDVAGFCAAVYQRGMRHVQVPTTLVAQVDSAFGGKTGVDLPEGKNYAGAYHQPAAVIVDPDTLGTLPPEEAAAGYVEVVKTALIAGGRLWAHVRAGGEPDDDAILGCLRTKLRIVAQDERDGGRRQVLNLGHTVGHAIEAATGYSRYRHGEAVGLGLLCALRLSGRETLRAEVAGLLAARGLPERFEGASVDDVVALVGRDKKRVAERVPFVLVESPGEVTPGHDVEEAALRAAVEELAA